MQSTTLSQSAVIALCIGTTIWGLSWTAFRFLQHAGMHPLWATAIIFSAGTIGMLLLKRPSWHVIRRHPELAYIALFTGLSNMAFYSALALGDVMRVTLLFYLTPVWTVILAHWLLHELVTRRAWMRVACSLAGAMFVLYHPTIGIPVPIHWVDWLALLSGLCFAMSNVILRRLHAVPDGIRTIAMFSGTAILSVILGTVLAYSGMITWLAVPGPSAVSALTLWSILFMVSNSCLQYGIARLPANISGILLPFEIVVTALSAWLLGASHLRLQDLMGSVLIIVAPWLFRERTDQLKSSSSNST